MSITKQDVIEALALAVAAHPQIPVDRSRVEAYYELLKDLNASRDDLLEAVKAVLQDSPWFPTIAAIRERVLRKSHQPPQFNAWEFATVRRQLTNGDSRETTGYVGSPQY